MIVRGGVVLLSKAALHHHCGCVVEALHVLYGNVTCQSIQGENVAPGGAVIVICLNNPSAHPIDKPILAKLSSKYDSRRRRIVFRLHIPKPLVG